MNSSYSINIKNLFLLIMLGYTFFLGLSIAQDIYLYAGNVIDKDQSKVYLLDVDFEGGFYTWYSVVMLFFASTLLFIISLTTTATSLRKMQWLLLGLVFLGLSLDECVSIHEKIGYAVKAIFPTSGVFYFAWLIPALGGLIVGTLIYIPFLLELEMKQRLMIITSAAIFLAGAIVMEMVSGNYVEKSGMTNATYRLMTNTEEALEGYGIGLFIYALLNILRKQTVCVRF